MLHLIFQSPVEVATLDRMDVGDVAVFFENAIFRLLRAGDLNGLLTEQLKTNRFCVLSDDLAVRGIAQDELINGLDIIDYAELVSLTVDNAVIQTWT
ncbi:DsrH/TusB family sulfur metabolism protein [Crenothrix sp.]|uniref:DsrH/TusB family sulfur metabolism protein n=1 Tax=Crenothrix sp. TaxID=3100433 RepID=UPI00374D3EB3